MKFQCEGCIVLPTCSRYCTVQNIGVDLITDFFVEQCCLDCGHDRFIVSTQIKTKFDMVCENCGSQFKFKFGFKDRGLETIIYHRVTKKGVYNFRNCSEVVTGEFVVKRMIKYLTETGIRTKSHKFRKATYDKIKRNISLRRLHSKTPVCEILR